MVRRTIVLGGTAALALSLALGGTMAFAAVAAGLVVASLVACMARRPRTSGRRRAKDRAIAALAATEGDVVALADHAGTIIDITPSARSVLGLEPTELAGQALANWAHGDDVSAIEQALRGIDTDPAGTTHLGVRVRGSSAWHRMDLDVSAAGSTEPGSYVLRLRDATERAATERSLLERDAQTRAAAALVQQALSGADSSTLATAVLSAIRDTAAWDTAELYRVDDGSVQLEMGVGPGGLSLDRTSATEIGANLAGRVAATGQVTRDNGTDRTGDTDQGDGDAAGQRSASIGIPVLGLGGVERVLVVRSLTPPAVTDADQVFAVTLAGVLALARRQRGAEQVAFQGARRDRLTGLANRHAFMERLTNALAHADNDGHVVGVLLIDLDHFKIINDSLGHEAGDSVIEQVSELFQQALRPGDTLARFGSDEFIVLARRLGDAGQAELAAQRMLSVLANPVTAGGREVHVTASVGVATSSDQAIDAGELVRQADAALHRAKELGRERVQVFSPDLLDTAVTRLRTEGELHDALAAGQLRVLYQPIVDLGDGSTDRVEALVRWVHPRRGLVAPDAFLPISESTGLIEQIGAWVIRDVIRQIAAWTAEGGQLKASVNLSARQLTDPHLIDTIDNALRHHDVDPGLLIVEVADGAIGANPEVALSVLSELADRGVAISIDDFGTGTSSVTHLRRLPVESVKIDRSLIADVSRSGTDYAVVAAMVQLAKAIGGLVVAEGVESEQQLELIRDLGCDLAQGFLFSPAVFEIERGSAQTIRGDLGLPR